MTVTDTRTEHTPEVVEAVARAISEHTFAIIDPNNGSDCHEWEDMSETARNVYSKAARAAIEAMPAASEEDERLDWDAGSAKLIKEAAELVKPTDGEAVFYIRVGGSRTHMSVKTLGDVDPDAALQNAISALNGERADLSNCPIHAPSDQEKLVAELVEALESASGMVESAMKDTNWSPVAWHEDSPCVRFDELITRARQIGEAD